MRCVTTKGCTWRVDGCKWASSLDDVTEFIAKLYRAGEFMYCARDVEGVEPLAILLALLDCGTMMGLGGGRLRLPELNWAILYVRFMRETRNRVQRLILVQREAKSQSVDSEGSSQQPRR